jgi:hypothetical protein
MRFIIAGFIVAGIFACTPRQDEAVATKTKTGVESDRARVETVVQKPDTIKVDSIKKEEKK